MASTESSANRPDSFGQVQVAGPDFLAFYAKRYRGIEYPEGALFTVRSHDGKPIADSERIRVYHGFGPSNIEINGHTFSVPRETVVNPQTAAIDELRNSNF